MGLTFAFNNWPRNSQHSFKNLKEKSVGKTENIPFPPSHPIPQRQGKTALRGGGRRRVRYTHLKRGEKVATAHWFSSVDPIPPPLAPHGRTLNRGLALLVFRWQKIEAVVLHSWTRIYPQTWRDTLQGATNKTPTKKRRPRQFGGGCGHQQSTGANTNFHHIETESACKRGKMRQQESLSTRRLPI